MSANTNKPVNIPEFKALIERYETIKLEEIKEKWENVDESVNHIILPFVNNVTARKLTGFGSAQTCTLCGACDFECMNCVYDGDLNCIGDTLKESYFAIKNSSNPKELLDAFRNRAKVLREFAEKNDINIKTE